MAEYFETEEVVKEYDRRIVRRILSYIKPYKFLMAVTLFTLALSTAGELLVPVIQQRVIDGAILARTLALKMPEVGLASGALTEAGLSMETQAALERLLALKRGLAIKGMFFVSQGADTQLSGKAERELQERGVLSGERWYAFPYTPGDPAAAVMEARPEIFLRDENAAAVRTADLYGLPLSEIRSIRGRDLGYLRRIALLLLSVLALVFLCTMVQTRITTLIGQRVMKDMRLELFRKTVSQSTNFLSRHPVGRIVTRLTGDVETINEFFTSVLVAFLKDLSVMAGVLVTLFFLSPRLALVVFCILPPVLVITTVSRRKARDAFRNQRTASSRVNSYLSEHLSGLQVVQLFRREKKSLDEFGVRNGELLKANIQEMFVFATFRPLVEWFATFTTAVIIAVGASLVLDFSLSLGVLIAFINLMEMFYGPVTDIAEKYTLLQSAMAGGERVFALLDTDDKIPDEGKHAIQGAVKGRIEFEDVHFSYKSGEEVLKGLSFTVNPGEMTAIVGYTGAGKTTITNVLARLWDIDSGNIRLDGVPIRDIPLEELRRSALPVLQDVFLFSGTVAENISLGLPLKDDQIEEAARAVHAHEFISRLPAGYKTVLSEGAANISSGQRQLISFARVIAHNPAVVILDEATSSVDTETEHLIQLGIQKVLSDRTSLVIAHRLSTIRHADRILVLSGGRLVEEGCHDELIRRGGLYAGLYRLQYEGGALHQ
ncbi:MAG: ABC transporter ATP-binding protein/permease [Treponema sp.]|jgi:ATP-binding cassette subfamily B protein|nr:ABC transporter ATP-binding protein/permease [Treponema sp.]